MPKRKRPFDLKNKSNKSLKIPEHERTYYSQCDNNNPISVLDIENRLSFLHASHKESLAKKAIDVKPAKELNKEEINSDLAKLEKRYVEVKKFLRKESNCSYALIFKYITPEVLKNKRWHNLLAQAMLNRAQAHKMTIDGYPPNIQEHLRSNIEHRKTVDTDTLVKYDFMCTELVYHIHEVLGAKIRKANCHIKYIKALSRQNNNEEEIKKHLNAVKMFYDCLESKEYIKFLRVGADWQVGNKIKKAPLKFGYQITRSRSSDNYGKWAIKNANLGRPSINIFVTLGDIKYILEKFGLNKDKDEILDLHLDSQGLDRPKGEYLGFFCSSSQTKEKVANLNHSSNSTSNDDEQNKLSIRYILNPRKTP